MVEQTQISYLDRLFIAAPCPVTWDSMQGGERVRDCSLCSRKVYNISDMTKQEADHFIRSNGTSQCMTFYRRADGTIMTDNCPVGLRKLRNTLRRATAFLSGIVTLFISLPGAIAQNNLRPSSTAPTPPPGMEYRPNPAGGGVVLRPSGAPAVMPDRNIHPEPKDTGANPPSGRANSKAFKLYLKGKDYERNGNSLVAALYYQHALKELSSHESYDPAFKQLLEKQLRAVQTGTASQP